jgi:hypothetical protein
MDGIAAGGVSVHGPLHDPVPPCSHLQDGTEFHPANNGIAVVVFAVGATKNDKFLFLDWGDVYDVQLLPEATRPRPKNSGADLFFPRGIGSPNWRSYHNTSVIISTHCGRTVLYSRPVPTVRNSLEISAEIL